MSIDEILNEMDELLEDSINLPFAGGKRLVDVERLRELMSAIKLNLPDEMRQARAIVQDRANIVATAQREADEIVHRAEARAEGMVSEAEIVRSSKARAAELLASAQQQGREMRKQVLEYCEGMLRQSEEELVRRAHSIREVRANLGRPAAGK